MNKPEILPFTPPKPNWRHEGLDLVRDAKGRPVWNVANAISIFKAHRAWRGVLGFDKFRQRRVLLKPIPNSFGDSFPAEISDNDTTLATAWFNANGFPTAKNDIVRDAMNAACEVNTFDPLCDFLNGLAWDGIERLPMWLSKYCGVEPTPYSSEVGLRWMISAAARGLQAGCKVDTMLVLEGGQGAGKSTALAVLAGSDWFTDSLPPMGSKDAAGFLAGAWIIEVAELEAMRRDIDTLKAFISRQIERFRPPYARTEVVQPRRCVFAGTTNKSDWQRDETGGRRFWPVTVGAIDIDGLNQAREQLWAEAVQRFNAGECWWLEGDVVQQAAKEVAERGTDDPWRSEIARVLEGRGEVTAKEILSEMGHQIQDMTPQLSKRVASEVVKLGWIRDGFIKRGGAKGQARFVRPQN